MHRIYLLSACLRSKQSDRFTGAIQDEFLPNQSAFQTCTHTHTHRIQKNEQDCIAIKKAVRGNGYLDCSRYGHHMNTRYRIRDRTKISLKHRFWNRSNSLVPCKHVTRQQHQSINHGSCFAPKTAHDGTLDEYSKCCKLVGVRSLGYGQRFCAFLKR